jgi:peptide/nickel transport system permease protein
VIFGARASLVIALLAVSLGLLVGSLLGLLAGYLGGVADALINIYANATLAFPPLVLLLGVVAVFHSSIWTLSLSLAFLSVPGYSRIMRAQAVSLRQREFVLAARAMGATHRRIMLREILPNAVVPVASYSFIIAAVTIIAEGSISYLGLGIPPPQPSWGGMIADGAVKLKTAPHVVFVPATVMFLTVLSFNRVGDAVRKRTLGERNDIA